MGDEPHSCENRSSLCFFGLQAHSRILGHDAAGQIVERQGKASPSIARRKWATQQAKSPSGGVDWWKHFSKLRVGRTR